MTPRPARHIVRWGLRLAGFHGVCLPPWGVFILAERLHDEQLVRHEMVHWQQAQRMGVLRYYLTYIYQVLRYGYRNAPMEREARDELRGP